MAKDNLNGIPSVEQPDYDAGLGEPTSATSGDTAAQHMAPPEDSAQAAAEASLETTATIPVEAAASTNDPGVFRRNHDEMVTVMRGGERFGTHGDGKRRLGIELERFVIDHNTGKTVSYGGDAGVEQLLEHMRQFYTRHEALREDGHLMGFRGSVKVSTGNEVGLTVSLEPAAQLECSVGPSTSLVDLLEAIETFDRQVHVASREMGQDYELLAEGYNPTVQKPLDLPLIPKTRYALMNAYLAQTGRYARDMMRCTASTQVSIDYGDENDAIESYRLAVALSPILAFLTDNTRSFRGSDVLKTPRMVRTLVWDEVDPQRCGIVPGTFDQSFSFEAYVRWLEGVRPILFTDSTGVTTSTGRNTERDILSSRALASSEILHLFSMVFPDVRFKNYIELRSADALRPRYAVAYAGFIKGIFYSDESFARACSLIGSINEKSVVEAKQSLREKGWDATVYGRKITDLVALLLRIARAGLTDPQERGIMDELGTLWDVRMVPRDGYIRAARKAERGY